ncbi:hypothetical protein C8J56DRAFT_1050215 [Mycena floridula]|nr:hypothetical protein C8J56DRAFT_1050215 [Mycena floridula]
MAILGGEKAGEYESGILDDSTLSLNPRISKNLRDFLWSLLPAFFWKNCEPKIEWTGITGYTEMEDPFMSFAFQMSVLLIELITVDPSVDTIEEEGKFEGQIVLAGFFTHGMPRTL